MSDLVEPVEEPPATMEPRAASAPVEDDPAHVLAHKNNVLGWALFGLFLLLFAGTWVVAFIYLALD